MLDKNLLGINSEILQVRSYKSYEAYDKLFSLAVKLQDLSYKNSYSYKIVSLSHLSFLSEMLHVKEIELVETEDYENTRQMLKSSSSCVVF